MYSNNVQSLSSNSSLGYLKPQALKAVEKLPWLESFYIEFCSTAALPLKIPILVKHRESIQWIPLTDDLVFPIYKEWLLWRKKKKATFWTAQAANRLRPCPDPVPVCKADSIPDQWTALTRACKTPWCSALQGTNMLSNNLRFYEATNLPSYQQGVIRKILCSQEIKWAFFFWPAVFWSICKQYFTAASKRNAALI